jgi:hypothetical protein
VTVTLENARRNLLGGQFGVDIRHMINRQFGVGGFARYSIARGHVASFNADLGGFQVGGGARLRF